MSRFSVFAALLAMLSACSSGGSDEDTKPTELSTEEAQLRFCENECDRFAECGAGDGEICRAKCLEQWHPVGLRSSVIVDAGECTRSMACEAFDLDDPTAECFYAVSSALPLTQVVLDYCERMAAKEFSCALFWEVADCASVVGRWRDEVLVDVQTTCEPVDCWELSDCYDDTFGKYK